MCLQSDIGGTEDLVIARMVRLNRVFAYSQLVPAGAVCKLTFIILPAYKVSAMIVHTVPDLVANGTTMMPHQSM